MGNNAEELVYLVISRIMDKDKLHGFKIASMSGVIHSISLDQLRSVCEKNTNVRFSNAEYDRVSKTLIGKQASLTSYASVSTEGNIVSPRGSVVVQYTIWDKTVDRPVGVVCYNAIGTQYNFSYAKLMSVCVNNTCSNFKFIMHSVYGNYVVGLDGTEFPIITMQTKPKQKEAVYNSALGEAKPTAQKLQLSGGGKGVLPQILVYDLEQVRGSEFNNSAGEKLLQANLDMKLLSPYYWACLQAIPKFPVEDYGTMGVTESTMYYDLNFVSSLKVSELIFVLMHEVCHLAMQHSVRFKSSVRKRDHTLWNVACDMYINTILCQTFGIRFGMPEKMIEVVVSYGNGNKVQKVALKTPNSGVFLDSIGETLDLAKDTPETIYDRLVKENPNFQQPSDNSNSSSDDTSNSGGGDDSSGSDRKGSRGLKRDRKSADDAGSDGSSSSGAGGDDGGRDPFDKMDHNSNKPVQTDESNASDLCDNSGKEDQGDGGQSQSAMKQKKVTVTYNGKKLEAVLSPDIMTDDASDSGKEKNIENSRNALQRIQTKRELLEQESGGSLLKNAGDGVSLVQRHIDFGLSQNICWDALLRNCCKSSPKKTFTLAQPNEDYMNMGITIAGRRPIGKKTKVTGLKIAVDVSGSVSKKEIELYLSEIANIFNRFDVTGELIYWSTMVGAAGEFSSVRDLLKIEANSTGGTDVRCVFDYLAGNTKVNGKREMTRVRDMSAIFILTDGCFAKNYKEYETFFGRRTVWIIDGNPVTFDPAFGRVIGLHNK